MKTQFMYTLGLFSTMFYKEDSCCDFLFGFLHTKPLKNVANLKEE